jgi:TolB protein
LGRISFLRGNEDGTRDVYVVDPDGSRHERVTNGIFIEGLTAWSPDGRYIIAQISQEGISTVTRIAVGPDNKGGEVVALTSDMMVDNSDKKADSALPAWSPDGSLIAFQSKKETGNFQVYVMDRDGNNKRRISSGQAVAIQPAWSPDGKSITYVGGDKVDVGAPKELYTVSLEGGTPKQITTGGKDVSKPTWSPDGKSILYLNNLSDRFSDIMIMNADGTSPRKLADGVRASSPQFNPAGDKVLYYFISMPAFSTPTGGASAPVGSDIYIVPTAGGQPANLTLNSQDDYQPTWSPDGTMLAWSSIVRQVSNSHKIVVAGTDGSGIRPVSQGEGDDYQPQWTLPPR